MASTCGKSVICALLVLVFASGSACPAWGVSRQDVLQPLQDDLERTESALSEISRQAALFIQEQKDHVAFLEGRRKDLDLAQARLEAEHAARRLAMNRSVLAGWQLVNELDDHIHVPLQGMVTMDELLARRESLFQAMEEEAALMRSGDEPFQLQGLGLITRNELEQRIRQVQEQTSVFEKTVEAGAFVIHYPGLGEVDRTTLEKHKNVLEERIKTTAAEIDSGDYIVVLPHLGAVSRNSLKAEIDSVDRAIQAVSERFKAGEEIILRASMGWSTAAVVKERLAELQEEEKALKQALKDKSYQAMLPSGWTSANKIGERLSTIDKEIRTIEQKLAEGEYEVALQDGTWANADELDKALINALLPPELRMELEKGRRNISVTAAIDIRLRQIEAATLGAWLKEFDGLAAPEKALLDHRQKWQKALLDEFRREQELAIRWPAKRKKWLERQMGYLP